MSLTEVWSALSYQTRLLSSLFYSSYFGHPTDNNQWLLICSVTVPGAFLPFTMWSGLWFENGCHEHRIHILPAQMCCSTVNTTWKRSINTCQCVGLIRTSVWGWYVPVFQTDTCQYFGADMWVRPVHNQHGQERWSEVWLQSVGEVWGGVCNNQHLHLTTLARGTGHRVPWWWFLITKTTDNQ